MKLTSYLKIGTLLALGVLTSVLTSSLMAQRSGRHSASPSAAVPDVAGEALPKTRRATNEEGLALAQQSLQIVEHGDLAWHQGLILSTAMPSTEITQQGNTIHVGARAQIREARQGSSVLWSLRVYDGPMSGKPLTEVFYNDQVAMVPPGKLFEPTFSDSFDLKPGNYHVEVLLYYFPGDYNMNRFPGENAKSAAKFVHGSKKVTIQ